jgi:CPA2 family monovalent cation:H+ antiporter-2
MAIPYFTEIMILLASALTIAPIFKHMKLSPVLGYLVAGAAIGPYAMGYVQDIERIQHVSELGIIFLMFMVGLELPLGRLKVMRTLVFGLGTLQVLATGFLIAAVCLFLTLPMNTAIIIGASLALSSTAMGIQLLSEREELRARHGRATFSVLLFQDICAAFFMTLIMLMAREQNSENSILFLVGETFLDAIIAVVAIFILGHYALRPLYRYVASTKNEEIFTATTLLVILSVSFLMGKIGLSMALGAFIAGMTLAETEYRHEVARHVLPFQGLLLGLFFMTVGMGIDFSAVVYNAFSIGIMLMGLMVGKGLLVYSVTRLFDLSSSCALKVAVLLCQGGEFAFVLLALARTGGLIDPVLSSNLMVVVALSMALTPILYAILSRFDHPDVIAAEDSITLNDIAVSCQDLNHHAIIIGFSEEGKTLTETLSQAGKPFVILDTNKINCLLGQQLFLPAFHVASINHDVLEAVGGDRAQVIALTQPTPALKRLVLEMIRQHFPHLHLIAYTPSDSDGEELTPGHLAVITTHNVSERFTETVLQALSEAPAQHPHPS